MYTVSENSGGGITAFSNHTTSVKQRSCKLREGDTITTPIIAGGEYSLINPFVHCP
nr:MAG TPA_asm: hypothetical protein [Bacteriophage sp.]